MNAKIKDFRRLNFSVSKNAQKRDIVDIVSHAYCAPGITRTNNTAFLLYGSGAQQTKGRSSNKIEGCNFGVFEIDPIMKKHTDAFLGFLIPYCNAFS